MEEIMKELDKELLHLRPVIDAAGELKELLHLTPVIDAAGGPANTRCCW